MQRTLSWNYFYVVRGIPITLFEVTLINEHMILEHTMIIFLFTYAHLFPFFSTMNYKRLVQVMELLHVFNFFRQAA